MITLPGRSASSYVRAFAKAIEGEGWVAVISHGPASITIDACQSEEYYKSYIRYLTLKYYSGPTPEDAITLRKRLRKMNSEQALSEFISLANEWGYGRVGEYPIIFFHHGRYHSDVLSVQWIVEY